MKLHHFGDVHYEEAKHRRPAPDGLDQGWHDVARAVETIVDAAIATAATEPTALVFGGDLARTRKPSPQTYEHFAGQIARAHAAGVPTIAIPGNHDISGNGEASALDPLKHLDGFHLYDQPGIAYLQATPEGVRVHGNAGGVNAPPSAAIVCVPWVSRSTAAANAEPGTSADELQILMANAILAMIKAAVLEPLEHDIPTYLLYHGTVTGGQTATGQMAHLFGEPAVSAIDLGNLGLKGVMLNHLHKRQELGSINPGATPIRYSSSVERLTFGDETDTKGWIEWTVGGDPDYRDTPARRFLTIGAEPWRPVDVRDAIVRVRQPYSETEEADPGYWERALAELGAHRVSEIIIERDGERMEHAAADLARTDPLEALADWLATEHPDEPIEWRDEVLAAGASLLGRSGTIETRRLNADTVTTPIPTPPAQDDLTEDDQLALA